MTIPETFALAQQHHRTGHLQDAEALYRQILAVQPNHAEALHYLGVIAHQVGRHDLAVELIRQALVLGPDNPDALSNLGAALAGRGQPEEAVATCRRALELQPDSPQGHYNFGNMLREQGRLDEAMAAYRRALALKPDFPEAQLNLGNMLWHRGQFDEAIGAFRRALALKPDYPEAHLNLGNTLRDQGESEEAITHYRRAVELRPDYPQAHYNLGSVLREQGRLDEAVAAYRRAVALRPGYPEVHNNLGEALAEQGLLDEAMSSFRRALELQPDLPEAHNNLGTALLGQGQFHAAVAAYHQALRLKPDFPEALLNLGAAMTEQGRFDEAMASYRRALELRPHYASARLNCSLLLLRRGDFDHGWPLFAARWVVLRSTKRDFFQPMWDGSPLDGRRVLIHAEQGLGDSIQFIRYARLTAERGAEVIVECQRSLVELFRGVPGVREVVAAGDALPPFELHAPMLSQPLIFKTTPGSIPRETPYLFAEPARRATWRGRIAHTPARLKVGLAWAGDPKHGRDRIRSLPLRHILPLFEMPGIDFFSLQLGDRNPRIEAQGAAVEALTRSPVTHLPSPVPAALIDHTVHIRDFADTAAFIEELDLIISVDTAVAHLAGALGRPVWTLLPFAPDWRWGLESASTPWYPTMRLFRQPAAGDWESVMTQVCEELKYRAESRT